MNIETTRLRVLLEDAVEHAARHVEAGGLPFVGVVAGDGWVSEPGTNLVVQTGDPSAHAEIVAMRRTLSERGPTALAGTTLLATGEPCALCYRFAADHGVAQVVYAVDDATAARWGFDYRTFEARTPVTRRGGTVHHLTVERGLDPFVRYAHLHSVTS
ncbi:nucleoside deaminase [Mobilicoccus caccae]|uniref:tRNA-specific adenosine deaminase n=1 Tax=Mobilicoccus caccae TaxID=1859295 RepID=A0ABQ6IXA9_9MICO|nr:nucleoside deaminase [Mobilicoccus caccae]GMA41938.1 tRNA-specific adenosine deaminase [Mobilicoccus caccae]